MTTRPAPSSAPAAALSAARSEVAVLDDRLWATVSDTDLVAGVEELVALEAHLGAVKAELVAEIDTRGVPRTVLHWGSTADWFSHVAGVTSRDGRRVVVQAHELIGDRTATLEALRAGTVSPDQAAVVVRAVGDLPGDPAMRARAEEVLLGEAARLNATDLARAGRHVADVVDPDRSDRKAEADLDREERAAHLQRSFSISEDGAGGVRVRGRGSVEDAAILRAALLPLTRPEPATDPETCEEQRDLRDHGTRMWDALVQLAQHAMTTDLPADTHGARPRVSVSVALADLRADLRDATGHPGTTDDGLDLHPSTIRRLACDADVIPVVLGTAGAILDVGRRHRTCPHQLWLALVARDRHCTFPGCSRPPVMGHAHHIVHWADGGETSLSNLALLCGEHHRVVHHTPWRVRLSPVDGRAEFLPPPRSRTSDPPAWLRHRPRRE